MDSFNKILSFVLGIVAVIILLLVLTRRVNRDNTFSLLPFSARNQRQVVTPAQTTSRAPVRGTTPATTRQPSSVPQGQTKGGVAPRQVAQKVLPSPTVLASVKTIPKTGAPTALTLLMGISLLSGIYLRKRS